MACNKNQKIEMDSIYTAFGEFFDNIYEDANDLLTTAQPTDDWLAGTHDLSDYQNILSPMGLDTIVEEDDVNQWMLWEFANMDMDMDTVVEKEQRATTPICPHTPLPSEILSCPTVFKDGADYTVQTVRQVRSCPVQFTGKFNIPFELLRRWETTRIDIDRVISPMPMTSLESQKMNDATIAMMEFLAIKSDVETTMSERLFNAATVNMSMWLREPIINDQFISTRAKCVESEAIPLLPSPPPVWGSESQIILLPSPPVQCTTMKKESVESEIPTLFRKLADYPDTEPQTTEEPISDIPSEYLNDDAPSPIRRKFGRSEERIFSPTGWTASPARSNRKRVRIAISTSSSSSVPSISTDSDLYSAYSPSTCSECDLRTISNARAYPRPVFGQEMGVAEDGSESSDALCPCTLCAIVRKHKIGGTAAETPMYTTASSGYESDDDSEEVSIGSTMVDSGSGTDTEDDVDDKSEVEVEGPETSTISSVSEGSTLNSMIENNRLSEENRLLTNKTRAQSEIIKKMMAIFDINEKLARL